MARDLTRPVFKTRMTRSVIGINLKKRRPGSFSLIVHSTYRREYVQSWRAEHSQERHSRELPIQHSKTQSRPEGFQVVVKLDAHKLTYAVGR